MSKFKKRVSVYLVEDDNDDAYIVKNLLKQDTTDSYLINHVHNLVELEQLLSLSYPDVILLDLGLTESTGLSSLIKANQLVRDIPIIILTGFDEQEFGERAIQLGAQDYVPKSELRSSFLRRVIKFTLERHKLILELKKSSYKDPLTLLNNRASLELTINDFINNLIATGDPFAAIYIDLSGFKIINNKYGHSAGDQVLQQVGKRFINYKKATDFFARISGDEFMLLIPNQTDPQILTQIAKSKLNILSEPFYIANQQGVLSLNLSANIGIAVFDDKNITLEQVINQADSAMNRAKQTHSKYAF